jgi:hypothetical protein
MVPILIVKLYSSLIIRNYDYRTAVLTIRIGAFYCIWMYNLSLLVLKYKDRVKSFIVRSIKCGIKVKLTN